MEEPSSCVLCEKRAMMLCDSDQAKLCWDCDEKVHSANFLVAKHCRVLLCRLCHSPTPWTASGTKLTPTVSFCHRCVVDQNPRWNRLVNNGQPQQQHLMDDDHDDDDVTEHGSHYVYDDDDYNDDDNSDDDEEEKDEEGDNQVVPMCFDSVTSSINRTHLSQ